MFYCINIKNIPKYRKYTKKNKKIQKNTKNIEKYKKISKNTKKYTNKMCIISYWCVQTADDMTTGEATA